MLVLGSTKKLNKVVIEMRKEILTVATVKHGTVEQAKEIALQAWNINNHGTYVGLKFSTYDDTVEVKYFEDSDTNIKSVVASWGEVVDTEKTTALLFDERDFKESKIINDAYDNSFDDGMDGEITYIEQ